MPIDNGDGTFDYSGDAGYALPDFDYTGFLQGADSVFMGNYGGADSTENSITGNNGAAAPSDNGGIAAALGSMWSWYNGSKENKDTVNVLASMFAGITKNKIAEKDSKAKQMSAEASQLNAQTNATADARKAANMNGKVNFGGLMNTPKFSDKLAVRRARSGAGLMGGTA